MDKKKSLLNVSVSIGFKFILIFLSLYVRRLLIQNIGNEINGLDSLFLSLIGFLSVTELGVGSAITFCMYKPVVEKNNEKVAALYHLIKKLYNIISVIIFAAGLILMPFLPYFAKDFSTASVNVYLTYFLTLVSVMLSYYFSSKISLINAYKDNYITNIINSGGIVLQSILQICVIIITKSYLAYVICKIVAVLIQWCGTNWIINKKYSGIICIKAKLDDETKKEVVKNVKAMFMHKIGGVLVNTVDSITISTFVGVVILGKYSNYTIIVTGMASVISLFFTPLTSIIGHLYLQADNKEVTRYFGFFHSLNFVIGCIFYLGYYAVIDDLIRVCFGNNLELSKSISFIITLNYFIQYMRQAVMMFKDGTGTFYNDRWKPIAEGISNLILSVAFVKIFQQLWGNDMAVVGVIVATIITNLFICHVVEPHVVFKYAFKIPTVKYYIKNYGYMVIFTIALVVLNNLLVHSNNTLQSLLLNGVISLLISAVLMIFVLIVDSNFRMYVFRMIDGVIGKIKKAV